MDYLKCLFYHVSSHASVDSIDDCETLRKELLKSMKIAKKFKEELKLANLEKEELEPWTSQDCRYLKMFGMLMD